MKTNLYIDGIPSLLKGSLTHLNTYSIGLSMGGFQLSPVFPVSASIEQI